MDEPSLPFGDRPWFSPEPKEFSVSYYTDSFIAILHFVSEDLVPRIESVRVDREAQAADHQPVILTLR